MGKELADLCIVLKRNICVLNDNMQAMMAAFANLAFSSARPTLTQLDWTSLTHSVTLVTTGLSHCSASADAKVAHGGNLVITLSPDSGYVLDGVTPAVTASNGLVSYAASGDNILITVANVTADVTVTISATAVTAPLSLHLSLSHCSCSSHTDGQTITQGSTISVVLNADTNYTLSQNDIVVTGGTAQVAISNNGATATIAIAVSGNVTVSAEAVFSLAYVSDGLVFHLDGSDTGGANDNQWVDKIGGIVFKKPTDSVITKLLNNDGQQIGWNVPSSGEGRYFAVMDGDTWNSSTDGSKVMTNLVTENGKTHFIIGTGSGSAIGTSACTIEAVFKQADTSEKFFVCMFSTQASSATSANAPYMMKDLTYGFYGLVSKFWSQASTTAKQTVSMSTTRAYANGSALTAGTAPSKKNATNEGGVFIGATRGSGFTNPTNQKEGYLYAVRIYNRILTENEVKHNQYVDDVLYELGLNLTDVSLNNG